MSARTLTIHRAATEGSATQAACRCEKNVSPDKIKALRKVAQTGFCEGAHYQTVRAVGPARVTLRTDEPALWRLWNENWFDAEGEGSRAEGGRVTVTASVARHEPEAYLCPQSGDVVFLGCADYTLCREWTLGMAASLAVRERWVGLQAATLISGQGATLLLCPDAAVLAACAMMAALDLGCGVQGLTWCWLRGDGDSRVLAHRAERAFAAPAEAAFYDKRIARAMDAATVPQVIRHKRRCTNLECLRHVARGERACALDRGAERCYWADAGVLALLPQGAISARPPSAEPLPVTRMVLLTTREGEQTTTHQLSPRKAVGRLKKSPNGETMHWWTPPLAEPLHATYARLLLQCAEQSRPLEIRTDPSRLSEGVGLLAESMEG